VANIPVAVCELGAAPGEFLQRTVTDVEGHYQFSADIESGLYSLAVNGWNDTASPVEPFGSSRKDLQLNSEPRTFNCSLIKDDLRITSPTPGRTFSLPEDGVLVVSLTWDRYPDTDWYTLNVYEEPSHTYVISEKGYSGLTKYFSHATFNLGRPGRYLAEVFAFDDGVRIAMGIIEFSAE
jgi:hypothetical protein